ncbi:MAG: hypothetical protein ACLSBF_00305 [Alphaproteobacteria bacterium]
MPIWPRVPTTFWRYSEETTGRGFFNKEAITPGRQKKSGKQPEPTLLETDLCPQKTEKTKIIDYLNHSGVYVDEIIRASGLDAATVSLELLELELSGKIVRQPGNKVALVK